MDNEMKELLEQVKATAEENTKILKSIRRSSRISYFFSILYWIVIISISVGAFYYVQPYIDDLTKTYSQIKDTSNKISNVSTSPIQSIKNYFAPSK